jgi:putative ABC transport system permease protein
VWAALWRKPVRTLVTFLSVTTAFTLFGLMIGFDSTLAEMERIAHADRIWVWPRFGETGMPITVARQVAALPEVKDVTVTSYLAGYVGDPKDPVFMAFVDDENGRIFPEWGPTPAQWDAVRHDRNVIVMSRMQAAHFGKKAGDTFSVIAPQYVRRDGSDIWTFKIAAIGEDVPPNPAGYIMGNYAAFDTGMPEAKQGQISEVDVLARDPAQSGALQQKIDRLFANSASPTRGMTERSIYDPTSFMGGLDTGTLAQEVALAGLAMILFLTANVIAQSVRERRSELATLMALGFSNSAVILLVAMEPLLICLAGAVCGVLIAMALAGHVQSIMPPGFGIPLPTISAGVFFWALAAAILLALLATMLPAFRLRRMNVAAALPGHA